MRNRRMGAWGFLAALAGFACGGMLSALAVGWYWYRSLGRLVRALLGSPSVGEGVTVYRTATGALDEIAVAAIVGGLSGAILAFLLYRAAVAGRS